MFGHSSTLRGQKAIIELVKLGAIPEKAKMHIDLAAPLNGFPPVGNLVKGQNYDELMRYQEEEIAQNGAKLVANINKNY